MNRFVRFSLALGSLGLAGCSHGDVVCTLEARPAIAVVVLDSITGAGLAANAKAVAREGAFADTLRGIDSLVSGVHEVGWAAHVAWDAGLHLGTRAPPFVPAFIPVFCIGFDLFVASYIVARAYAERTSRTQAA